MPSEAEHVERLVAEAGLTKVQAAIFRVVAAEPGLSPDQVGAKVYPMPGRKRPLMPGASIIATMTDLNKRLARMGLRIHSPRAARGYCFDPPLQAFLEDAPHAD